MPSQAQANRGYRLRPAPRSRTRGRPQPRERVGEAGRVIRLLPLLGVLFSYIRPLLGFVGAWQDKRPAATELSALRAEHAQLVKKAGSLDGRDAAQKAPRRLGMVSEGERAYVIKGLPG